MIDLFDMFGFSSCRFQHQGSVVRIQTSANFCFSQLFYIELKRQEKRKERPGIVYFKKSKIPAAQSSFRSFTKDDIHAATSTTTPTKRTSKNVDTASVTSVTNVAGGNKRARTIFTAEQLERMEREFHKQQYVVGHERVYLADALNLTEAQVRRLLQKPFLVSVFVRFCLRFRVHS